MSTPSPSRTPSGLPLRSALKSDDDRTPPSNLVKAVQIAAPETPSTLASDGPRPLKEYSAGVGSVRLSGRPPIGPSNGSRSSTASVPSTEGLSGYTSTASLSNTEIPEESAVHHSQNDYHTSAHRHVASHGHGNRSHAAERLLAQVADWLQHEKAKAKGRKKHQHHHHRRKASPTGADVAAACNSKRLASASEADVNDSLGTDPDITTTADTLRSLIGRARANSADSESSDVSFDRLQRILDDGVAAMGLSSVPCYSPASLRPRQGSSVRRNSGRRGRSLTASSDTDYVDGDVVVPSCDVVLDNSKTMSYSMGRAGDSSAVNLPSLDNLATPSPADGSVGSLDNSSASSRKKSKEDGERKAWLTFKTDIIRLAHTLRLKGWRLVPLNNADAADQVGVERLSGALTNAVYVITPPKDLSAFSKPVSVSDSTASLVSQAPVHGSKRTPERLLLRIYGPQVEHLIDREAELAVLRRLAKKKIGPRVLGTFTNGRFEQFFNASPLTLAMLREPGTSVLIAKRMRELHDGVEVLYTERMEGPTVWKNWERWLDMAGRRMSYLDGLVREGRGKDAGWKGDGFVCGVPWEQLKAAVEKYRVMLDQWYCDRGGKVEERLVFAHNDTQYGNILRLNPPDKNSPLLQPRNEHKQLIVIDFEYAAPNTAGLEFANHFTEWTYNYHDAVAPHACNHTLYPTPEQQHRFIKAYVEHRPQFTTPDGGSTTNTPLLRPQSTPFVPGDLRHTTSSSSFAEFMLDARVPSGGWTEEERKWEEEKEARIKELMEETRMWRLVNSAQWVIWGIVQAHIRGFVDNKDMVAAGTPTAERTAATSEDGVGGNMTSSEDPPSPIESDDAASDEFDYLSYSRDRALFMLADCVLMGVLQEEDLPEGIRGKLKRVEY